MQSCEVVIIRGCGLVKLWKKWLIYRLCWTVDLESSLTGHAFCQLIAYSQVQTRHTKTNNLSLSEVQMYSPKATLVKLPRSKDKRFSMSPLKQYDLQTTAAMVENRSLRISQKHCKAPLPSRFAALSTKLFLATQQMQGQASRSLGAKAKR